MNTLGGLQLAIPIQISSEFMIKMNIWIQLKILNYDTHYKKRSIIDMRAKMSKCKYGGKFIKHVV